MKSPAFRRPRSLGELVERVYDEVRTITDDDKLAAQLATREIARRLVRAGRVDLAHWLSVA